MKKELGLSDAQIDGLVQGIELPEMEISAKLTLKRKENSQPYAKVSFIPLQTSEKSESIEKDLFFGLFILGTEKHESRRIDNQLRGRAGRQ